LNWRTPIERAGGGETVRGALLTAALVAVPVAPSLAAVLGRWLPAAEQPFGVLGLAGLVWLLLAAWFLQGVHTLLQQHATDGVHRGPSPGLEGPVPFRVEAARRPERGTRGGAEGIVRAA
jgi:hypothetical protein